MKILLAGFSYHTKFTVSKAYELEKHSLVTVLMLAKWTVCYLCVLSEQLAWKNYAKIYF